MLDAALALLGSPMTQEASDTTPIVQEEGNAYNPPSGALFDGDENTFVQLYTYAAGGTGGNFDPPIDISALELVASGTPGYSGEPGWYGGFAEVIVTHSEGDSLYIRENIQATSAKQRFAIARKLTGVSRIYVKKPSNSRFRAYEVVIYLAPSESN